MKKLILTLAFLLVASPAFAWNLFFIDQLEDIAYIGDPEELGFVLGTHKVSQSSVVIVKTVGANSMFIYVTNSTSLAQEADLYPEFRGYGYIDMIWRVALGIGNGTMAEMKHITGAHWYSGGEHHFGCVHDWEAAGSPTPAWRGRYRGILGIDIE